MSKKTILRSIRDHCLECNGYDGRGRQPWKGIRHCPQLNCPFWIYRMGKDPVEKKRIPGNAEALKRSRAMRFLI